MLGLSELKQTKVYQEAKLYQFAKRMRQIGHLVETR